jgi:hypothetical protein
VAGKDPSILARPAVPVRDAVKLVEARRHSWRNIAITLTTRIVSAIACSQHLRFGSRNWDRAAQGYCSDARPALT